MKKHSICHKTPYLRPLWRAAALMLALLLGLTALPYRAAAEASSQVSVGLYFVRNALESANLQNVTGYGSGYQLGIYEADASGDRKQFRALAETGCTEISMLVDRTMYLSGNSYASTPSGGWQTTVGAYHLELVYAYGDYAAAQQAASNYPGGFVAYSYGQYYARFGSYATYGEALADAGAYSDCAVTGESDYGITVVNTLTGAILFELDQGAGTTLGVVPLGGTETRTWFKGYQYNGGFRYDRPEGGAMHVANIVPLEQYVAAVLSREFVPSWPDEALKAAACCIRTFAATGGQHSTFDVCNDTCCQVYRGVYLGAQWEHLLELCRQTAGQRIYYNGAPILATYHSSNGGATASSAETWGVDYPYLQSVYDPFESTVETGTKNWSRSYSLAELTELARLWGADCGSITQVYVSSYSARGLVTELTFVDSSGRTFIFTGDDTLMLDADYYSRRYVVIPPGGSATVTDVGMGAVTGGGTAAVEIATDGDFVVYDGQSVRTVETVSVLTAAGTETLTGAAAVTSGGAASDAAYPAAEFSTRVIYNDSNGYLVYGSGWGHNVGLSAYGAYAMAQQGYTYRQILQYSYQGVTIG